MRLFKQKMGVTPHQYILQHRIEKAKHLLQHSELSIAEIAVRTGFCDQSHLTRCFKRRVGVTPKSLYKPVIIADISSGFAAICRFSASVLFLAGLTVDLFAMQMVQFSLQFLIV